MIIKTNSYDAKLKYSSWLLTPSSDEFLSLIYRLIKPNRQLVQILDIDTINHTKNKRQIAHRTTHCMQNVFSSSIPSVQIQHNRYGYSCCPEFSFKLVEYTLSYARNEMCFS